MRTFFVIGFSFLVAFLLEALPFPSWSVWIKPAWIELVLIFWLLAFPDRVGIVLAFFMGILLDLLLGTLLGLHAVAFIITAYFILRFRLRIRLMSLWQQAVVVFILVLLGQVFFSWVSGLLGGFRADLWLWLPALSSASIWPWVYTVLHNYVGRYRFRHR